MKTHEDFKYDYDERAAIMHENNANEAQMLQELQDTRRRVRDALRGQGIILLQANKITMDIEHESKERNTEVYL